MDVLNFTFKLLKHGGIFLLRVFGILAPVVLGAIANASGRVASEPDEKSHWRKYQDAPYDVLPDGTHYYHDEY